MAFDDSWKPKPRKPLRPVSKKRARENRERRANLHARYGDSPECYACAPLAAIGIDRDVTGCRGWAEDGHEPALRGRGADITDPDQVVPISRACHDWCHANQEAAIAAGLLEPPRMASPRSVP